MKERRKGLLWEMALILLTVAACLYSTGAGNIFGAKVDWSSQHSVFPEYFRQQFYRTGQFFPEFALNIGVVRIFTIFLIMDCLVRSF